VQAGVGRREPSVKRRGKLRLLHRLALVQRRFCVIERRQPLPRAERELGQARKALRARRRRGGEGVDKVRNAAVSDTGPGANRFMGAVP
jgi:hypothetical protein